MSLLTSSRGRTRLAVPAAAVLGLLLLAGCSGGSASGAASTGAAAQSGGSAPGGGRAGAGMGSGGGVSGTIAAIQGAVLQVQGTDSQTAVTYAADTVITQTVSAALAQVTVGSCVVASSGGAGGAAGGTATASSTTTASATTVRTSAAVDGACTSGFAGGRGSSGMPSGMPTDLPTDLPSGMPTDLPSGMPSGGAMPGGFGQFTIGLVTAVSGTTITVQAAGLDGATTTETVEVGSDTTYTASVPADAAAIVVGLCASAQGTTDTSGTMTATTLTLSQPTAGSCTQAFGMGSGMGRAPGGNAASNG